MSQSTVGCSFREYAENGRRIIIAKTAFFRIFIIGLLDEMSYILPDSQDLLQSKEEKIGDGPNFLKIGDGPIFLTKR
jgi:hypothetical protein